jgi:ribonuclease-3|tara:strand:- start:615 stop:1280 length:666 start_codon:yes stop_codon:yes gene_type:complete
MKSNIKTIENNLKINFNNKKLLIQSLIHKSYNEKYNNEKLEFLGDRVIGLVIAKKLLSLYPDENEGAIDKKFAYLVNKKTCGQIGRQLNLKNFVKMGKSLRNLRDNDERILSDCCESVIGALYLDQGYTVVEKFILRNWHNFLKKSVVTRIDPKTKLQEFSLKKFKKLPIYKSFKPTGPNHNPIFKVQVSISNSKRYFGQGKSKKLAEQNAASKLVKSLKI